MTVEVTHRFTVRDYHLMAEMGVLCPDARVELLDGRILDMSPIGPFHGGVVKRLSRLFHQLAHGRWLVSTQDPLHLDEYSEPQPDLMLLRPAADDYTRRHPEPRDVWLLIEVADTTLELDRGEKLSAYGRAGIPEVWIVNLSELVVEVYREPHLGGYARQRLVRAGEQISPAAFPDAIIEVGALLER